MHATVSHQELVVQHLLQMFAHPAAAITNAHLVRRKGWLVARVLGVKLRLGEGDSEGRHVASHLKSGQALLLQTMINGPISICSVL